jgi:hypothetical protein
MKQFILTLGLAAISAIGWSQDILTYDMVQNSTTRFKGTYSAYESKDGRVYTIGDTINVGNPSGMNGKFVHFTKMDIFGTIYIVGAEAVNTHIILKKIRVGGTKRAGWKVAFQTKGFTGIDNYFLYIEDAITAGEVDSGVMSSDEALAELKKAKDKLDLGLITLEEFEKIKQELSQIIQ